MDGFKKTIGHLFYPVSSFGIISNPSVNSNWSYSLETLNSGQNRQFFVLCDLEIWWMTWKSIKHLFSVVSSFVHHFSAISEFKLELQSGNTQFGSKSMIFFLPCDLEIWWVTLKNNRATPLYNIKPLALFHHHMHILTGVIVQKRLNWVLTSVSLTFDLWLWPFPLLSLVITFENFMMIRQWEHSEKGLTDWQRDIRTDRRTEPFTELLGRSQKPSRISAISYQLYFILHSMLINKWCLG